ncbi:unnamed protein product [Rotaria magnacalcarata]|uniref:Dynein heavy chain n=2 Tax=Rotaria magnacalcarata TaxID=392030 RepID=A0A8S2NMZ3_9BILA|nr:unnamed protein product [Rotaria magnacalcarata]
MIVLDMALILMKRRIDPIRMDYNLDEPFYASSKAEILRLLNFSGLLSTLLTIRELNDEIIELLAPYSEIKDLSEKARKAYQDLATLKTWTDKIQSYHAINKQVIPIKDKVQKAENSLRKASRKLARAERELERTEIGLTKCQNDFDVAMQTKQAYQADYDALLKRRNDANTLISGLTGEKIRWNEQNKAFEQSIEKLIGNSILVTAFLSYCGPYNQDFRQRMLNEWQKQIQQRTIPFSDNFDIIEQLNDEATIGEWNLQGLPNDDLSIQNGIIATSNYRYPLLIDPQLQGRSWMKNMERDNDILITTLNSKIFRQQLEDSISLGRPLLIEDVDEELDPMLDNILEKNYFKIGLTYRVKVGDREVDVNHTFRLYITTKLANPNYSPEVCARLSVIDFTVTQRGLEDQLLSLVIANERVELERERVTLARETTKNKRMLKELEENLLIKLTSIEGSVLDDPSLVEVLNANKRIATEVKEKVSIAEDTKLKISAAREEYRPVAVRGSILYFLMSEIAVRIFISTQIHGMSCHGVDHLGYWYKLVNHMYQISLQQFLGLFHDSMIKSNKIAATQKRIQNINDYLTYRTWFYTTRGLYEDDRLMFTLLMALRIDLRRGKIRYDEFQVLVKGGASLDLNTCPPKPFRWLNDSSWLNLLELSRLKEFHDVIDRLQKNERIFKDWFDKQLPSSDLSTLPETYENLNTFHRFLFIRCISPDRTILEARHYIQNSLGIKYLEIPVLSLELLWEESNSKTSLLGLLSSGADPTSNIQTLAKKKNIDLFIVSMGQGQEVLARRYLQQTVQSGGWLLLQNAHLGLDYLEEFHENLISMDTFDPSFRVWLTTETHSEFAIQILQSSIKFTNEPPQGVRAGLKRTYGLITQDKLEYIETIYWRPLLYATSFLHSILQERRKFGPLGWNIPYEFNQTDWEASVQYIQNHLDDMNPKLNISWKAVQYMISEIQYGGRITDDRDRRLMITYAQKWFNDLLFSSDFKFYDGYSIPKVKRIEEYIDCIDRFPFIDSPHIFGLDSNADITYSTNRAKSMLEKILHIQPKEANSNISGGETRDKTVHNLANDMLIKLPKNFIQYEVREKLRSMGILNPMIIFLRQEIHRIDRVIRTVRNSLNDLQLAIDGIIILNDTLREILDSVYDGRVPIDWTKYSWESSTLGFWFSELLDRYTQYNNWLNYGRPKCFWMTGFFNPNGFLTAMRQEVTRMHQGWSLDTVTIDNIVLRSYKDDIREAPTEGVYVYGLYLEGAGWDRKNTRLHESQNKVVYVQMPVIHIFAINPSVANQKAGLMITNKKARLNQISFREKRHDQSSIAPHIYMCPVYKKPIRTDLHFVAMLKLASNNISEHWILRGVALLCDIK